jgi:hypothetical protein
MVQWARRPYPSAQFRRTTRHENQKSAPGYRPVVGCDGSRDLDGRSLGEHRLGQRVHLPRHPSRRQLGVGGHRLCVLETDLYFGYAGGEDFTYKIGYTGYYYTDDFDDTYNEVNLGIGYGIFALDVAIGEWDGFGTPADYTFTSITIAPEKGPYYKFGSFGDDFDGDYLELGYTYSMEDEGVDLSIAAVFSDDLPVSDALDDGFASLDSGEWALTFGIKKNIAIGN